MLTQVYYLPLIAQGVTMMKSDLEILMLVYLTLVRIRVQSSKNSMQMKIT